MLKLSKIAGLLIVAATTSACVSSNNASQNKVTETPQALYTVAPTVVAPQTELGFFPAPAGTPDEGNAGYQVAAVPSGYNVTDVQVVVPDYLVVSEADVYVPQADIVWREDPLGDRRAQVQTIIEDALRRGTAPLNGSQDVILAARVNMFHAITEKARNTVGGKHNIQFDYVLLDAETRQPVTTVQSIDASLKAYGGRKAYRAMRRGETQKVRITQHVADMVLNALSAPKAS